MSEAIAALRPATRLNLKNIKVLIVDDNAQALDLLNQALIGFGVRDAVQSRSVADAAEHLGATTFDLVIADGEMPGQDGFALTDHIRTTPTGRNFTVPIMILSSFTPRQKVMRARDAGANLVVTKPIVPANLLGRIQWLANTPRQFVVSPNYCGPDRRFHKLPLPDGVEERRADEMKLLEQPERAMSQNEIDSMFG